MNKKQKFSSALILSLCLINGVSAAESLKEIKIEINGKSVVSDVAPFIDNDRTLVPIRVISENLGYSVNWDNQTRKVTVKNNDKSIELTIGRKDVNVNGNKSSIDVAPMIKDERTFVPLRFISESFDNDVNWDNNTRTVRINKKEAKVASILNDSNTNSAYKSITPIATTTQPKAKQVNSNEYNNKIFDDWRKNQNIQPNVTRSYNSQRYHNNNWSNNSNRYNTTTTTNDVAQLKDYYIREAKFLLDLTYVEINGGDFVNNIHKLETEINNINRDIIAIEADTTSTARARRIKLNEDMQNKIAQLNALKAEDKYLDTRRQTLVDLIMYNSGTNDSYDKIKLHNQDTMNKLKVLKQQYDSSVFETQLVKLIRQRNDMMYRFNQLKLDDTHQARGKRIDLKKEIEKLDDKIHDYRNQSSQLTLSPEGQKLLDEYEENVKKSIENYHNPQTQQSNKTDTNTSSNDSVLKELTKNLRLFYYIFPANTPSGLYSFAEAQNNSNYTIKEMSIEIILDNGKPFHYVLNGSLAPNKKEKLLSSNNMNKNLTGMTLDRMYQSKVSEFYAVVILPSGEETSVGFMNNDANSSWVFDK